ncbi:MAG TPA: DUF11 domain-containing protein, partial [Thermoplasmatales archaeon]|nr:DUF11 domain-containing protein [Thermoplasmatales archaeon]
MEARTRMLISLFITIAMTSTAFTTVYSLNMDPQPDPYPQMNADKKVWNETAWADETTVYIGDTVRFNISVEYVDVSPDDKGYELYNITIKDNLTDFEYIGNPSCNQPGINPDDYLTIDPVNHTYTWFFGNDVILSEFENISTCGTIFYLEFDAKANQTGTLENVANVSGYETCSHKWRYSDAKATVHVEEQQQPDIDISKEVTTADDDNYSNHVDVDRGADVKFKLVVANTGNMAIDNVTVRDELPEGLTYNYTETPREPDYNETVVGAHYLYWYFEDVAPGWEETIIFHADADGCGNLTNVANVTGTIFDVIVMYDEDSTTVNISCPPGNPNVSLIKEVSLDGVNWAKSIEAYLPNVVHAGNKIYFRLNVTNTGDINLTGLLEDFLPPFLKYNYDSDVPVVYANDSYIKWAAYPVDPLVPGESSIIHFSATPLSGGNDDNVAIITADQGVNATDSAHIILYEPHIDVEKEVKRVCDDEWSDHIIVNTTDLLQFKISLTYHGNPLEPSEYAFHNITIKDILPEVLQYIENSSVVSGDWPGWDASFDAANDSEPDIAGNVLTWDFDDIFWIPHNHTLNIVFTVEVNAGMDCGTYENLVIITGTECSGTNLDGNDTAEVEIPCPEFKVDKKVLNPGTGEWSDSAVVYPGRPFKFNITVTNTGGVTINSIQVVDTLPDVFEYIDGSAVPTPDSVSGQQLTWYVGPIAAGESVSIVFEVRAQECEGCYNNTVVATMFFCDEEDHEPVVESDEAMVCVVSDANTPESVVNSVSPYWHNEPFVVNATASDDEGVGRVELYYSYSANNSTWGAWTYFGKDIDGSDGWSWLFSGADGYYRFYSIAVDLVGNFEDAPAGYDAEAGLDVTPPESYVEPIVPYVQESIPIHLSVNASDNLSGVSGYSIYY